MKFDNGFRILKESKQDDKFYVIDNMKFNIGDEFRIGPNGYFEYIGNPTEIMNKFVKEELAQ